VGLRSDLDVEARGKSVASAGDRTLVVKFVVRHCTDSQYVTRADT
jgi:hypothetical protein